MTNKHSSTEDVKASLSNGTPTFWTNPNRNGDGKPGNAWEGQRIGRQEILDAADRFHRFRKVLTALFPELQASEGVIESELVRTQQLQQALGLDLAHGRLYVKADHSLPIAGSIKARGGIHEVLQFAEQVALQHGLITPTNADNISSLASRELLSKYRVAVGSTGNLGLSIGIIASALGFQTTVHMSSDAKEWKKKRLRDRGVSVVEHEGDYAAAVAAGRKEAEADPFCHFVDDESSLSLFCGYSAAALALKNQIAEHGITVNAENPLLVYLPCGVGGAPGGIAYGLAHIFGKDVHCFFAEPIASPCFLVSMLAEDGSTPSVYDLGLDNKTEADGLAVPRASECASQVMRSALAGVFTVADESLFQHLHRVAETESLRIEPSAAAAFDGPRWLVESSAGREYLDKHGLAPYMPNATHILWTTGGLFVPEEEYETFHRRGKELNANAPQR
ncbi:D-serine ammonia-lyase [Pseudomonas sp. GOM7]|uniref:D-serine ammonia-lyase n=1 Tax=Pseudomonas sp. GOM7 TaxID=2998079 RepID=UPI00227B0955|nr:D-serine ammonia-lyase [Pseudomonas sp. GOM7]WAJ36842.1 D-serine ammonia-lyase [Pseudomonas sp. GOM7]